MRKLSKILSICFTILLIATATISGTLAYANWTAEEYAENTEDTLKAVLIQQQRTYDNNGNLILEPFEEDKALVPLVESAQYNGTNFDKYGMPMTEGYVDQIIRIKNEGTASAYVRLLVAIPAALDDPNDAGHNALHWNLGNRFMPEGNFSAENDVNSAFDTIQWELSEKAIVGGVESNIYRFTYQDILAPGGTTDAAAFVGFYLDSTVNVVDGHIILDGVDTGFMDDEVKIYVAAQAVQSYGFTNSQTAFQTVNPSNNPWA